MHGLTQFAGLGRLARDPIHLSRRLAVGLHRGAPGGEPDHGRRGRVALAGSCHPPAVSPAPDAVLHRQTRVRHSFPLGREARLRTMWPGPLVHPDTTVLTFEDELGWNPLARAVQGPTAHESTHADDSAAGKGIHR